MQVNGFDIISDLNLEPFDDFDWDGKATSLYCIVAGNISSNIEVVLKVLLRLSRIYQGVFFVPGKLEYETATTLTKRTEELSLIADNIPNVCMLHQHVVVIDGVAILGANGWGEIEDRISIPNIVMTAARLEDFTYLRRSLSKLQRHLDIKKIVIVTSAVPHDDLYYKEKPLEVDNQIPLHECLQADTEHKVTNWVFGTYSKTVDTKINSVNYVNNPYSTESPYWPKRITIEI